MKLFCCADTHGKAPPLCKDADVYLHAGDFYNLLGGKIHGVSHKDFARMKNNEQTMTEWRKSVSCPVYFVRGNHDTDDFFNIMKEDISGKIVKLKDGLFLFGIGWSGQFYFDIPLDRDIAVICDNLLKQSLQEMKDGDHSIILTHYPPCIPEKHGKCEEGFLFNPVRKMIDALKPILVVEGHTHQDAGKVFWYNKTLIAHPSVKGSLFEIEGSDMRLIVQQQE